MNKDKKWEIMQHSGKIDVIIQIYLAEYILVFSGSHNNIPQFGWHKQQKLIF